MLAIFCMEIEKQVVLLNDNLLVLETQSTVSYEGIAQTLASLMRSIHSIKGAARIVGLDAAVEVAHMMEDCLAAVKQGQLISDSGLVDVLLGGVDWFSELAQVKNDAQPEWLVQQKDVTCEVLSQMSRLLSAPVADANKGASVRLEDEKVEDKKIEGKRKGEKEEDQKKEREKKEDEKTEKTVSEKKVVAENAIASNVINPSSLSPNFEIAPAPTVPSVAQPISNAVLNGDSSQTHLSVDLDVSDLAAMPSDRVVKVNADNLNQLMALAGESLVEVNWLQPFADTMQQLKQKQQSLTRLLEQLQPEVKQSVAGKRKLAVAKKVALDCHGLLSDRIGELDQFSRRFSQLSDNLYREVIASHMCPFSDGIQGFPRMVRDLAITQGKQIKLEIVGKDTQIDRDILDKLEAPLTHMLRNAIAHGIELPAHRQRLDKPAVGTIRLEASHRAGMLSIFVSDDGCGIDLEQLRQLVVQKQLTSPTLATQLSEAELMEFLFLPGFSTAQQVTELAGRGVGLDIAKNMVQEVGGLLRAFNEPSGGLSFHFQLPLTLSVIRALVVEISGEPYAFGLTRIDQVRLISPDEISMSENRPYLVADGENISLVKAQQILELPESPGTKKTQLETTLPVVIVRDQGHSYGIIVEKLLGERELVVRPLDERFGKVQDISAAALTEEGLPLLIIDVADLIRTIEQKVVGGEVMVVEDRAAERSTSARRILVVDDSLTVREMERQLLQNHGYQVDVAVNGMEGWNMVRTGDYDLLISDIDMPRMNGIELVEHVKGHPQLKQLPVIIVSYKDRQSDQLAGLNAGASYYLTKSSFQDNSLITAVRDLIT